MLSKKYWSNLGVPPTDTLGVWPQGQTSPAVINDKTRPLACYANYTDNHHAECYDYDIGWDYYGPQFFAPTQCIQVYSWNRPKVASPIIGIIGEQSDITDSIGNYYIALRKWQYETAAKFGAPFYQPKYFENQTEFDDYISSADY